MNKPRLYTDESDLDLMRAILQAGRAANNGTYYIHPGDLNWWWYYGDPQKIFPKSVFLWDRDGQVIGWSLTAYGAMDVYFLPELRGTPEAEAMYIWAEEKLTEIARKQVDDSIETIWVGEHDSVLIPHLKKRGFTREDGHQLIYNSRYLDGDLPAPTLPPGYTVRAMEGDNKAPSRARASYVAFQSKKDWAPYLQNYLNFSHSPVYDPDLDVVAVSPDGEIAAFAICWLDPVNQIGHFEPVGTHPDYQRKGLGRAVLYEGMRRMRARGMRSASVCVDGDNPAGIGVYAAAGFQVVHRLWTYKKKVDKVNR